MKEIIKEIAGLFIIITISCIVAELGDEEQKVLTNPVRFFAFMLASSIIAGLITHWIKRKTKQA
jgi:hypothetical protein